MVVRLLAPELETMQAFSQVIPSLVIEITAVFEKMADYAKGSTLPDREHLVGYQCTYVHSR